MTTMLKMDGAPAPFFHLAQERPPAAIFTNHSPWVLEELKQPISEALRDAAVNYGWTDAQIMNWAARFGERGFHTVGCMTRDGPDNIWPIELAFVRRYLRIKLNGLAPETSAEPSASRKRPYTATLGSFDAAGPAARAISHPQVPHLQPVPTALTFTNGVVSFAPTPAPLPSDPVGDQYLTLPDTTLPAVAHETAHAAEGHITISHDDHHVTISHAATGSPSTEHHSRGARHAEHTHSDLNGHITISHQSDPGRPPHPAGGELVGLLGAQGFNGVEDMNRQVNVRDSTLSELPAWHDPSSFDTQSAYASAAASHASSVEWAGATAVHSSVGLSSHHSIMHESGLDPDDANYEDNEYDTYAGTTHSYMIRSHMLHANPFAPTHGLVSFSDVAGHAAHPGDAIAGMGPLQDLPALKAAPTKAQHDNADTAGMYAGLNRSSSASVENDTVALGSIENSTDRGIIRFNEYQDPEEDLDLEGSGATIRQ